MRGFRKLQLFATLLGLPLAVGAAAADEPPSAPFAPQAVGPEGGPAATAEPEAPENEAARLDTLLAQLAEPGREDWERVQTEILRIWSRSGSPSMDLLLQRGGEAMEAEDYMAALDDFSALTDHAPDFAEGWNARATVYFGMGEFSLAMADLEHALALNPRHFGALATLGAMFEAMDDPDRALEALRAVQRLNPNSPDINNAVDRLQHASGEAEL
jgi:tetratricopeptide (TPR) repeat protein